jgi:hypothetical protein
MQAIIKADAQSPDKIPEELICIEKENFFRCRKDLFAKKRSISKKT